MRPPSVPVLSGATSRPVSTVSDSGLLGPLPPASHPRTPFPAPHGQPSCRRAVRGQAPCQNTPVPGHDTETVVGVAEPPTLGSSQGEVRTDATLLSSGGCLGTGSGATAAHRASLGPSHVLTAGGGRPQAPAPPPRGWGRARPPARPPVTCAHAVRLVPQRAEVAVRAVGAQGPAVPRVALAGPVPLSAAVAAAPAVPTAGPRGAALARCGDPDGGQRLRGTSPTAETPLHSLATQSCPSGVSPKSKPPSPLKLP